MFPTKIVGSMLVLLLAQTAYAQELPLPERPAAAPPLGETAPDVLGPKPEEKLEPSSTRADTPSSATASAPLVDPELAAAAEQDIRAKMEQESANPIEPTRPIIMPMAKLNPDISFILDMGFGWFSQNDHLRQGGHSIDENGFALQALELAASAAVDPYFRFDFYFQVQHLHLEEAFLTTLALPGNLQIRTGYLNVAFGRQNPQHLHSWNYVTPPLTHTRFMSEEHFSGAGIELSAILPLPWYALVLVEVMTPSSATAFRSSTFGTVEQNGNGRTDGLEDFLYVGRFENFIEVSPDWSLLVGASAAFGQSPFVPDNRAALYGSDLFLKWRPLAKGGNVALALTLETMVRDTQVSKDFVRDWGGYAQLDLQMSRRFMAGLRGDITDLVRGTVSDPSRFPGQQARGSLSFTFLPTHFSKLRLQADISQPQAGGDPVVAIFLQTEVSAGEHGAHRF